MSDAVYFLIVRIVCWCYWRGTLSGAENLPSQGPAVFVTNHIGPDGPIGTVCSIHLRFYPWIVADMVNRSQAADYLRFDFVEPSMRLKPPLSMLVARLISLISVSLLTSLGCIPVNREKYEDSQKALRESLDLLLKEKILLIFPEDPDLEENRETKMQPFMKGFTRLGELFYEKTGRNLPFYPVAVHESRRVRVGKPITCKSENLPGFERMRLKDQLESDIQEMYLELRNGG